MLKISGWVKDVVTVRELERRWKLVRKAMSEKKLDFLICERRGYIRWFTDRPSGKGEIVAFPIEGDLYFASHGDSVHHKHQDSYGLKHLVSCSQPRLYVDTQAPKIVEVLKAKKPDRIGFVGMGTISAATYLAITKGLPDVKIENATDLVDEIKAVKSEEELIFMKRSAEIHDMGVEVAKNAVRPGRTGNDVIMEVQHAMLLAGSEEQNLRAGSWPPGTPNKYVGPRYRKMRDGDVLTILIECSGSGGYYSEMMPIICIGRTPKELERAFEDAKEVQKKLATMARPGADPMEMLRVSDHILGERGYPKEERLAGHSQGYEVTERPALSPLGETLKLKEGMVMCLHPTAHAEKAWGLITNNFLVTETGGKRLQEYGQEIIIV